MDSKNNLRENKTNSMGIGKKLVEMKSKMKSGTGLAKLSFIVIGFAALIWFLIRVIPKPSRAAYPCMQAAFPIASGFVVYITGLIASIFVFDKLKKYWREEQYIAVTISLVILVISGVFIFQSEKPHVYADTSYLDTPNQPIGTPQGIFPGRVVWSWNPDATNENCTNNSLNDAYYLTKNSNMDVIQNMIDKSLLNLTGQSTISSAWNSLFISFNEKKGKGSVGYIAGEKIFIKTNGVSISTDNNFNFKDAYSATMARTSPQPVLAILRHLINECGIPEEKISVGDPIKSIPNEFYNIWHSEFPNVIYISNIGGQGRTKSVAGTSPMVFYSDKGEVLRSGNWNDATFGNPIYDDKLYTVIEEADYMINIGALKVHERAGVTFIAKNHFGSHSRVNALHVHNGLVNPDGLPVSNPKREGYGLYRVLVDLLGHKKLGGNTVLGIVDGLWGGAGANLKPVKFQITPFNNDFPNSIFMSQDLVALESVCFDILKAEFTADKHAETFPQMIGVDDHLHQAADSTCWPSGIKYDPENDGVHIASLGVHEHWNNVDDKQYSKNLGAGNGIELVNLLVTSVNDEQSSVIPPDYELYVNYPNPFNPSTTIKYSIAPPSIPHSPRSTRVGAGGEDLQHVQLKVYDMLGREVATLVNEEKTAGNYEVVFHINELSSGIYFYTLNAGNYSSTRKMIFMK